jgi:hypothetical protein
MYVTSPAQTRIGFARIEVRSSRFSARIPFARSSKCMRGLPWLPRLHDGLKRSRSDGSPGDFLLVLTQPRALWIAAGTDIEFSASGSSFGGWEYLDLAKTVRPAAASRAPDFERGRRAGRSACSSAESELEPFANEAELHAGLAGEWVGCSGYHGRLRFDTGTAEFVETDTYVGRSEPYHWMDTEGVATRIQIGNEKWRLARSAAAQALGSPRRLSEGLERTVLRPRGSGFFCGPRRRLSTGGRLASVWNALLAARARLRAPRCALLAPRRRGSSPTWLEGASEGRFGVVTHLGRDRGDLAVPVAQLAGGQLHAPLRQVRHGRLSHELAASSQPCPAYRSAAARGRARCCVPAIQATR